ncbi:MAG: DegT/DnrJ/EryC1/StrS family aminotransferase [Spirochaetia bacterium]|jgi:dTDP-4-amino-4,6-dideoxygalactose transaminase|nr:DegT/DnrJ/EryC1/StrS family aminotransferase [Spirochaetia bacterium]
MSISVFKPFINRKDMNSVLSCLVSESLENGSIAKQFSADLSRYLGVEEGHLLKEYKRAIEIVLKLSDNQEKNIVLISPLSSVYYKKAADEAGLKLIYIDVDPDTANISFEKLASAVEENQGYIHSVIIDSPLGFVPEIEKIAELDVNIIEDISNSFGARAGERKLGSFGSFTIMNMDPERIITTGSGTFVAGKSKKEKDMLRSILLTYGKDILLPDLNAAIAVTQLDNIEKIVDARAGIADNFVQAVMKTRNKTFLQKNEFRNIYYSFPVIAESSIREIRKYAQKKGVETAEAFEGSIIKNINVEDCPEAQRLNMRSLLFPLYPNIGKSNAEKIIKVISTLP